MCKRSEEIQAIYAESVAHEAYQQGIEALGALMLEGADVSSALQLRSHLQYLAGDHARAKRDLDEAIRLSPQAGGLYYDRGVLHHRSGAYYLALRDFCEAVFCAHAVGDDDLIDAAEHHVMEIFEKMRRA